MSRRKRENRLQYYVLLQNVIFDVIKNALTNRVQTTLFQFTSM